MCSFDCVCGLVFFFFWLCSMVSALAPFRITGIVFDFCFFFFFRPSSLSFSESYLFFFRLCFFLFPTQVNPKFVPCSYYPISGFFSLCAKKETKEKKRQREMKKKQQRRREETLGHNPQPRKSNGSVMRGRRWKQRGNSVETRVDRERGENAGQMMGLAVYGCTRSLGFVLSLFFFFFCAPVFIV